jgi:hypothetical protein
MGRFGIGAASAFGASNTVEEVISRATSNVLFIIVINPSKRVFRFRLVVGLSVQIIEVIVAPVSFCLMP